MAALIRKKSHASLFSLVLTQNKVISRQTRSKSIISYVTKTEAVVQKVMDHRWIAALTRYIRPLREVRRSQEKVSLQEEEFRKYRELVRENLHKISEANNKLEEINRTKEMTDRKSAKYIELLHEEHHTAVKREELIKEQEHLEKKERDSFSDLTRVTQDAREQTNIAGRNFGYFYMTVYVVTYLAMNHIHTKRNEKHVEDLSNMVKGTHAKSTEQLQYIVDKMDMLVNNTYLEETHSPPNNAQESIAKLISTITALQNNMESLQREIQSIRIVQKEITGMPSNTETAKPTVGHSFRIKNENQMSVEVPVEETGSNSQKYIKGAICVGSMVAAVAVLANWLNRS